MRTLVTGGAGFIGSHLCDALTERGDHVTVIDNLTSGRLARLDDGAVLHRTSVTDASAVPGIIERARPDVIFHLAAQIDVRASVARPAYDADINVLGTISILEAARSSGAQVIMASTGGAIYGVNAPVPAAEDVRPEPEAPYGTSKYCAEQYMELYNRMYHCRHAVLRLANVYGPRQEPDGEAGVIAIFCGRAAGDAIVTVYGDGKQTRDYTYVGDVVQAFIAAADAGMPGIWNIGTGLETNLIELIGLVGKVAGRDLQPRFVAPRPGELRRSALDSARARADLGWHARTPLAAGIDRVYRWVAEGKPDRGRA
jgi:UDP-glucose 4-epimerase